MPGAYNVGRTWLLGHGESAPLYDWAGDKWQTEGPRPGQTLTLGDVLDPDTGELKTYSRRCRTTPGTSTIPWVEFVQLEQNVRIVVHPNKGATLRLR